MEVTYLWPPWLSGSNHPRYPGQLQIMLDEASPGKYSVTIGAANSRGPEGSHRTPPHPVDDLYDLDPIQIGKLP
jgi:hypothetical protein